MARRSPANNWMKLTKGIPRTSVGAWSRSAPLRGTTPRLLLDSSPSQLIQVLGLPEALKEVTRWKRTS